MCIYYGWFVLCEFLVIDKMYVEVRKGGYIVRIEVVWFVRKNNVIWMGCSDVS